MLSALGFYSVTPGSGEYVLVSPKFKKTTINLENDKKFIIDARANTDENVYIKSATLNGKPYFHNFLTHAYILKGCILKLDMDSKPALNRGLADEDKPFSLST